MTLYVLTCVSNDNRFSIWTDPDILRLAELTLDAEKSTIFVFKKRQQICRWKKKIIFSLKKDNKFVFKKNNKFVFKKWKNLLLKNIINLSLKKENKFCLLYFSYL